MTDPATTATGGNAASGTADLTIAYIPSSHLDLFWLGSSSTCLERGAEVIRQYVDRCLATDEETFLLDTALFAAYFLERHPEYLEPVRALVRAGRLEIGAAWTDRWETLVLGESHIRNVVIGQRWCRTVLGAKSPTAVHPDLPSLVPQAAQTYGQAGVRYYVTSRKLFEHGQIWRHRAPDGSGMLVLNYPLHYLFTVLSPEDIAAELLPRLQDTSLPVDQVRKGFPQGVIPVPASAGDLADRHTFRKVYGQDLDAFVAQYREQYPNLRFGYTIPSEVLRAYDDDASLPELSGEVPSVWGVAADEEARFFQRDRQLEASLLTAETLAAVADHLGLARRPEGADTWKGAMHDDAFFGRNDPIEPGRELRELWKMHVFTQDHNGGGLEGAQSTFEKRAIQERAQSYAEAITQRVMDGLGAGIAAEGSGLLVFNPHGQAWSGPLETDGQTAWLTDVPAVGYRFYPGGPAGAWGAGAAGSARDAEVAGDTGGAGFAESAENTENTGRAERGAPAVAADLRPDQLVMRSASLEVAIDLGSGSVRHLRDRQRDEDWGHAHLGRLYATEESGNDTTLRIAADADVHHESLVDVEELPADPLFRRVRIRKRLLRCDVEQTLTLWAPEPRVDFETRIFWWGKRFQQVRLGLPSAPRRGDITYGSPFYGVGWDEVVPGARPRRPDEILPEDYERYREVQGWLHLRARRGGLTICTSHPGFFFDGTLEAVLLRTPPSCGDGRLFWENAGEQVFRFSLFPAEAGWQDAGAPHRAATCLRPPVAGWVTDGGDVADSGERTAGGGSAVSGNRTAGGGPVASGNGTAGSGLAASGARTAGGGAKAGGGRTAVTAPLPQRGSFLAVDGALLSALYPGVTEGSTVARFYDAYGRGGSVRLSGPLAEADAVPVDFLEESREADCPLEGRPGDWRIELAPWRIQSVRLGGADRAEGAATQKGRDGS